MQGEFPETTVIELAQRLRAGKKFAILDVRESWEIDLAKIDDERVITLPLSKIARERQQAFPPELRDPQAEIVVMCHHGVRSLDVTRWMIQKGWKNVLSLAGGIEAYAEQIDPTVGQY